MREINNKLPLFNGLSCTYLYMCGCPSAVPKEKRASWYLLYFVSIWSSPPSLDGRGAGGG
jgi:hypothetical protein